MTFYDDIYIFFVPSKNSSEMDAFIVDDEIKKP